VEVTRLITTTVAPNANSVLVIAIREPKRSMSRPYGKQKAAPMSVAQRLIVA
jgi:hypothetical protein